ncbi:MAG: hypothetical protein ACYC2H_01120 [Thermoplasmatota archaeon]
MSEELDLTGEFYDNLRRAAANGEFESIKSGLDQLLKKAFEDEIRRPSRYVPGIKTGIRYRQKNGSLAGTTTGFWWHEALASAIYQNNCSCNCLPDMPGTGLAPCCGVHLENFKADLYPIPKDALIAGSAETLALWKTTGRNKRKARQWWPEKVQVPKIPLKSDLVYSQNREDRMQRLWEAHGKEGPREHWDPENWNPLSADPHNGPWYVDYVEIFLQDPRMRGRRGFYDVEKLVRVAMALDPIQLNTLSQKVANSPTSRVA